MDCSSLTEIILPEGFREIYGYYVFSNCTSVTRIVLPSTLRNYGIYAFQGTSGDLEINSDIVATDNYYGAFERWTGKNAKLSDNVNTIGLKAFANSSLTNITFGSGLKTIDDSAFLFSKKHFAGFSLYRSNNRMRLKTTLISRRNIHGSLCFHCGFR